MGPQIIARNYAETLLTLAQRHGGDATVDAFGAAIDQVATLLRSESRVREFLQTPRVNADAKKQALRAAFGEQVPELFLRFLLVVVEKRRQGLLPAIANEYHSLVDQARGRVRADITLAQAPDPALERDIVTALERRFGKTVIPTFQVDPELIGGIIVRVGDQILDGSFRRRIKSLRRRLLETHLATPAAR